MVIELKPMGKLITSDNYLSLDRTKVLHGPRTQTYGETNNFWQLSECQTELMSCMVLGLKPMGKLIIFDKYLSVGQNKGPVWILRPQPLKRLITSSIYLSDEQNLKRVCLLRSLTLSPLNKDVNFPNHKPMRKFALGA